MSVNKVNSDGSLSRVAGGILYADAPIGTISPFGGSDVPSGYLLCNGQAISRTAYAELFSVIGTMFGEGNGSTTFNVPDLRETVPVGIGENDIQTIANHDVYTLGQFKDDQMQGHWHTGLQIGESGSTSNYKPSVTQNNRNANGTYVKQPSTDGENGTPRTGTTTHGKQLGVNYIIKAKHASIPADFIDAADASKPIEVSATLDFNEFGNALVTPPTGYKVISAIMPDYNWAFDVFYTNNVPYVHSRGLSDYSAKITGAATLRLVYIKA